MAGSINTTHGLIDVASLERTLGFEERPTEFVVWIEWRKSACAPGCFVCDNPVNPQPIRERVLVRRDAHCILKEPSVVADAIAASVGG